MGDQQNNTTEVTPKIKYDWYQTETHVVVTVLIKNIKNDQVKIQYEKRTVSVSIHLETGKDYSLELDLAHEIVPQECSHKTYSTKIEVKMKKLEGIRWQMLEGDFQAEVVQPIPKEIINATSSTSALKYPTSFKKDWDAIERELKEQEKNEKPEADEALNNMFQEIYGKGSDEVKKAMNKSFLESGGTVLSTNWKDVGKKKVEVQPPDGMEFKSWKS